MAVVQKVFFQCNVNKHNLAFFLPTIQHLCLYELNVDCLDSLVLLSVPLKSLWLMDCSITFSDAVQIMQSFPDLTEVSSE